MPDCQPVIRGADWDRWDLQVRGGVLGAARVLSAVEEHGAGRQLVRFRVWPLWSRGAFCLALLEALLAAGALLDGAVVAACVLAVLAAATAGTAAYDTALSMGILMRAIDESSEAAVDLTQLPAPHPHLRLAPPGGSSGDVAVNGGGVAEAGQRVTAMRAREADR